MGLDELIPPSKRLSRAVARGAAGGILFCMYSCKEPATPPQDGAGWTVTSYADANEVLYAGEKVPVQDPLGQSLGAYRADFLEAVHINGSGKGDSLTNPGQFLHYDPVQQSYYLWSTSLGAWNNTLNPWTTPRPSVAAFPHLPQGTAIRFLDLGPDARDNPEWVNALLLGTTFYVDDKMFLQESDVPRLDVYVGLQRVRDPAGTPESLLMRGVRVHAAEPSAPNQEPER